MEAYDLVIIGSGPGGYRAAVLAALRGLRTAIIEKAEWGGCCLNRGCVPKKVWYHTARLASSSRDFAGRGLAGALHPDLGVAWEHQRQVVNTVRASYLDYLKRLGVRVISGEAILEHHRRVTVPGGPVLEPGAVILATGSRPRITPNIALVPGRIITTDQLFALPPPPGMRVAILGAGAVGTELAFILRALGKEVVWLTRHPPLAGSRYSAPALAALGSALEKEGIVPKMISDSPKVRTGTQGIVLEMENGAETVDWLLIATGREPMTEALPADLVRTDSGFLQIDSRLETTRPGIYAIGDCAGGPLTANQALADAGVVVNNLVDGGRRERDMRWVPVVIYSAVELARLGLGEDQAEAEGFEPAIGFAAFGNTPQALAQGDARGFVRLVGDLETGALLGGEAVGADAGELIHVLSLVPDPANALSLLERGRYNHPARAEEFQNAVETLAAKWQLGSAVFVSPAHDAAR